MSEASDRSQTNRLADEPRKTRWQSAGSGYFYKIERPGFSASNLKVAYPETTGRYLRLTVSNGDDQPLSFDSIAALAIDTLLVSERRHLEVSGRALGLYSGNEKLPPPAYDLSRTIGRLSSMYWSKRS